jgi:hypothetical protein
MMRGQATSIQSIPSEATLRQPTTDRPSNKLPTYSIPSSISGRRGHQKDRSDHPKGWHLQRLGSDVRTAIKPSKTPGSFQTYLLFTMHAEHVSAVAETKLVFLQKDIIVSPSGSKQAQGATPIVRRAVRRPSAARTEFGGAERDRTADPLLAKQVLSQLSYSPNHHKHPNGKPSGISIKPFFLTSVVQVSHKAQHRL